MNSELVHIPVSYDRPNSVFQAIIENKFEIMCQNVSVDDMLLYQTGSIILTAREVSFGKVISNYDLFPELGSNSLRFIDPLAALCHARNFPEHSRRSPVATMFFNKHGLLCCFIFSWDGNLRKFSSFSCGNLNNFWFKEYKFLVV